MNRDKDLQSILEQEAATASGASVTSKRPNRQNPLDAAELFTVGIGEVADLSDDEARRAARMLGFKTSGDARDKLEGFLETMNAPQLERNFRRLQEKYPDLAIKQLVQQEVRKYQLQLNELRKTVQDLKNTIARASRDKKVPKKDRRRMQACLRALMGQKASKSSLEELDAKLRAAIQKNT